MSIVCVHEWKHRWRNHSTGTQRPRNQPSQNPTEGPLWCHQVHQQLPETMWPAQDKPPCSFSTASDRVMVDVVSCMECLPFWTLGPKTLKHQLRPCSLTNGRKHTQKCSPVLINPSTCSLKPKITASHHGERGNSLTSFRICTWQYVLTNHGLFGVLFMFFCPK